MRTNDSIIQMLHFYEQHLYDLKLPFCHTGLSASFTNGMSFSVFREGGREAEGSEEEV